MNIAKFNFKFLIKAKFFFFTCLQLPGASQIFRLQLQQIVAAPPSPALEYCTVNFTSLPVTMYWYPRSNDCFYYRPFTKMTRPHYDNFLQMNTGYITCLNWPNTINFLLAGCIVYLSVNSYPSTPL
jgi:hypothetical protein